MMRFLRTLSLPFLLLLLQGSPPCHAALNAYMRLPTSCGSDDGSTTPRDDHIPLVKLYLLFEKPIRPAQRQVGKPKIAGPQTAALEGRLESLNSVKNWITQTYEGNNDCRKDITIEIQDQATGTAVRTFHLIDTFPVHFEILDVETTNPDVLHWTLEVRVNRWEAARRRRHLTEAVKRVHRRRRLDEDGRYWLEGLDPGFMARQTFDTRLAFLDGIPPHKLQLEGSVSAANTDRQDMLEWFSSPAANKNGKPSTNVRDVRVGATDPDGNRVLEATFLECVLSSYNLTTLKAAEGCGENCVEAQETIEITVGYSEDFFG